MIRIAVACPQEVVPVNRGRTREIVRAVLDGEGIDDAEISLAFVDNPTIQQLNQRYLGHNEPTDVLSFPLSEPPSVSPPSVGGRYRGGLAGELVVGVEVAKAQAEDLGHDVQAELALCVIHGLLHLCGYDDKSPSATEKMRRRERHYLQLLGLPAIAPG
jgi:probable rRNA maturation factor